MKTHERPAGPRETQVLGSREPSLGYAPGQLINGKYRLVALLGEGAMGVVWRAVNQALEAEVAIKFILGRAQHADSESRLLREARLASRLSDPSIVQIFDMGTTPQGDPYIVMELLVGEALSVRLRGGAIPPVEAVQTLLPIVHALRLLHRKEILHRDIKPENIFLHRGDADQVQPKLVDFGIARMVTDELRLTSAGEVLGSPLYMSPEQARGEQLTAQSDVWAASVVLYEVLTGNSAFEGGNYNAVMRAILTQPTPTLQAAGLYAPELEAILARGLSKSLARRFSTAAELGQELARWLLTQGVLEDISGGALTRIWLSGPAGASSYPPGQGPEARHARIRYRVKMGVAFGSTLLLLVGGGLWLAGQDDQVVPGEPASDLSWAARADRAPPATRDAGPRTVAQPAASATAKVVGVPSSRRAAGTEAVGTPRKVPAKKPGPVNAPSGPTPPPATKAEGRFRSPF